MGELADIADQLDKVAQAVAGRHSAVNAAACDAVVGAVRLWTTILRRLELTGPAAWWPIADLAKGGSPANIDPHREAEAFVDLLSVFAFGDPILDAYARLEMTLRGTPMSPRQLGKEEISAWPKLLARWADRSPAEPQQPDWSFLDLTLRPGRNRFVSHRVADHVEAALLTNWGDVEFARLDPGGPGERAASVELERLLHDLGYPVQAEADLWDLIDGTVDVAARLDSARRKTAATAFLDGGYIAPPPLRMAQSVLRLLAART